MTVEIRVLLVEDEAPLRRSLEKYLERAGYAYDSCSTACEALGLAERIHYDILLAEYHLPDANGTALLTKLKRIAPAVATIMISEYDYQTVATDLLQANVRSFLKKPFDLVELESALSSARPKLESHTVLSSSGCGKSVFKVSLPPFSNRELSEIQLPRLRWNSR